MGCKMCTKSAESNNLNLQENEQIKFETVGVLTQNVNNQFNY